MTLDIAPLYPARMVVITSGSAMATKHKMLGGASWLSAIEDLITPLLNAGLNEPICFLLGAGASLSSGAPSTDGVAGALMRDRPERFPTEEAVYEYSDTITIDEKMTTIGRLFDGIVPHIGYRCLAAMARRRPIIVVNLNWDGCVERAAAKVGLTSEQCKSFDLAQTKEVDAALAALARRGHGLLSVHVHGSLAAGDVRFAAARTLKIEPDQKALLCRLMKPRTIVIGTSLSGPRDVKDVVEALHPTDADVRCVWVLERGTPAREPSLQTQSGEALREALKLRASTWNFVSDTEVDFDMFMVALRAAEVGLKWDQVVAGVDGRCDLPLLRDLIPPDSSLTRPLLDAPKVLIAGRAGSGKSVIAHLLGHWGAIIAADQPRFGSTTGRSETHAVLVDRGAVAALGTLVCDDCFDGKGSDREATQLSSVIVNAPNNGPQILMTSSPAQLPAASGDDFAGEVTTCVLDPLKLWRKESLRFYAMRLSVGRPLHTPALLCGIDRDVLRTPEEVARAFHAESAAPERKSQERAQLFEYVRKLFGQRHEEGRLLVLVRLQDFYCTQTRRELEEAACAAAEPLLDDPWGLLTRFAIDEECLRLGDHLVREAVDEAIACDCESLRVSLEARGERVRWAVRALIEWKLLAGSKGAATEITQLSHARREMFGAELVARAGEDIQCSIETIEQLRRGAADEWAMKEAAAILVERWDELGDGEQACTLRNGFLGDRELRGTYALFEALLRGGGGASQPSIWHSVCASVLDVARGRERDSEQERLRRREVALCFDALLWRHEAPEHERLLGDLLEAATDPVLRAMFATAAAYHHDGARRLAAIGAEDPGEDLGAVNEEQAIEMAWIVEWHFVHQSRNRAIACRRYFHSTRAEVQRERRRRLLGRGWLDTQLPGDWVQSVCRVARRLGEWEATAGWAVHLVLNINATAGNFVFRDMRSILKKVALDDRGLVTAGLTYEISPRDAPAIREKLETERGKQALQAALGEGVCVCGQVLRKPRFLFAHQPWRSVLTRWHIDGNGLFDYLGVDISERWKTVDLFRAAVPVVVAEGASQQTAESIVDLLSEGDLRSMPAELMLREATSPKDMDVATRVKALLSAAVYACEERFVQEEMP